MRVPQVLSSRTVGQCWQLCRCHVESLLAAGRFGSVFQVRQTLICDHGPYSSLHVRIDVLLKEPLVIHLEAYLSNVREPSEQIYIQEQLRGRLPMSFLVYDIVVRCRVFLHESGHHSDLNDRIPRLLKRAASQCHIQMESIKTAESYLRVHYILTVFFD